MGNGTVYKRGNSWCVGFTMNGRRVRETVGPSKKVAEKVLSLRMTQVLENRYFPPNRQLGRMPFNEFAETYLERVVPHEVNPNGARSGEAVDETVHNPSLRADHASRD